MRRHVKIDSVVYVFFFAPFYNYIARFAMNVCMLVAPVYNYFVRFGMNVGNVFMFVVMFISQSLPRCLYIWCTSIYWKACRECLYVCCTSIYREACRECLYIYCTSINCRVCQECFHVIVYFTFTYILQG